MGVIYKAYDVVTKRFVALKTLWADAAPTTIDLFEREWTVLARLSHPNIVDILDTGDWVFNGQRRPYFVMPLLPGRTLEEIIKTSGERLTVDRTVDIISQACRGLQAAHDQSLIHRDIKPSNIFVMEDDTVKIIDFGVVYLADGRSAVTGIKGTPLYMAPEQLEMKPATPLSDIFSLAVVCYETLTGRQPFARPIATEIAEAIRTYIPPAASEINPAINQLVSRTVHKAMAKQPWYRFSNAREFGDTLQKALRNEPIERFERSKILPRIERVKKAYSEGDYQFALEILKELESEGHLDSDMSILHIQIEQVLRQKSLRQLLEDARIRMEEEEFPLALHKVADALAIDPENIDARTLKEQIERRRNEHQVAHWFRLVREHLDNNLFTPARQGLQEILKIDSSNTEARQMLAAIDQTEQDILKNREEKQRLYESAVNAYRNGETGTALTHLERAISLARRAAHSSSPDLDSQCQSFHDSIRSERDTAHKAYQEGRNHLLNRNVGDALAICEEYLRKHPDDPRFQALKLEAEEVQREALAAAIAEVSRRVDAEPDLDRKHKILQDAVEAYPNETHFRSALKLIADRRDLVNAIVSRARQYEERGQFTDAASQLDILHNIYPLFPDLDSEIQRLNRCKDEQLQAEAKACWIEQIDGHLNAAEYDKALALLPEALAAFPADSDLLHRQSLGEQGVARNSEASVLLKEGQDFCAAGNYQEGLFSLRKAERLDPRNRFARAALLSGLVSYARDLMPNDWHAAEPLVKEALDLEPTDPVARSLLSVLDDNRRQTAINIILAGARNYQADGRSSEALQIAERGLLEYPNDHRLIQFLNTLRTQARQPLTLPARPNPPATQPEPLSFGRDSAPIPRLAASVVPQQQDAVLQNVPPRSFFPPPRTDLPPKDPPVPSPDAPFAETPDSASARDKALVSHPRPPRPRREAFRSPPFQPGPPQAPGLLEELSFKGPVWVIATLAAFSLILCAGVYQLLRKPKPPVVASIIAPDARTTRSENLADVLPSSPGYPVSFESNVSGTRFSEDGQTLDAASKLGPGSHNVEAFHEGYLPETKTFTVDPAAAPLAVKFDLRPILPLLRLSSSIAHGRLVLDEAESFDLQSGVATKEDLALGPHTVKIYDGSRQVFAFAFEAKPNEIPVLLAPIGPQTVAGAVIASMSGTARIYTSISMRASIALPVAPVPPFGLAVPGSPASPARFLIDAGKGQGPHEQSVDPSALPTLTVQLAGVADVPFLGITSNVPNCQISVDNKPLKIFMKGQSASIPTNPGSHAIRLTCPGYQDLEKVALVKPDETGPPKLDFVMEPVPVVAPPTRRAVFMLSGAPPDTPVFQNQIRVGTVAPDGTFSRETDPGTFTWEWRKPGYEPRKETRTVKAGDSVRVDGAMNPSSGSLVLKVVPEDARISIRGDSDNALIMASNNVPLLLAPGSYRVTAQAPEYGERTESVVIVSGTPLNLTWNLEKLPVLSGPQRFFENGDAWKPVPDFDGWWFHPGSGYSSSRTSTGAVSIDFLRRKHAHKINILADCPNQANCVVYSIDGHSFTTKVILGGATVRDEKKPHGMDGNSSFHLVFEMTPEAIVVKNRAGTVLSSVDRKDPHGKLSIQDDNPLNIN